MRPFDGSRSARPQLRSLAENSLISQAIDNTHLLQRVVKSAAHPGEDDDNAARFGSRNKVVKQVHAYGVGIAEILDAQNENAEPVVDFLFNPLQVRLELRGRSEKELSLEIEYAHPIAWHIGGISFANAMALGDD